MKEKMVFQNVGLEDEANELKKMLDNQEYPYEVESILKMISKDFVYPLDIINAYRFGVIQGQNLINGCGSACGSE